MKKFLPLIGCVIVMSCADNSKTKTSLPSIVKLADSYYERSLETFPENAYYADINLTKHNGITSNELSDQTKWENYEDSLYVELSKLEINQIPEKKDKITYWLLKEELEASIDLRICKRNLWDVNHLSGWQTRWISLAEFQPVGSEDLREQAFERWNKFPVFVATEIKNLKKGIVEGYSMPKEIVELVIEQLQVLRDYPIENSPFMSPAKRDDDPQFQEQWEELVTNKILPTLASYQQYLTAEYRLNARDKISVVSLPNGSECYKAFIRTMTTTNKSANELFKLGRKIVSSNKTKVSEIGSLVVNVTQTLSPDLAHAVSALLEEILTNVRVGGVLS